ncbi:GDP/UDP-N,N'-diacetylbacillosamine 2-epimerase (hydrolyzing) [Muribaculaceae bacterium]|nr:GDP/UDP-N,N'-diacetylbacillosamine 2-epimerase (hydrolyzing) [Muribaculaceae bacterium]
MRKICVVVASRANYGRVKPVLTAIKNHEDLELQLVVGASMMLERYGKAVEVVEKDGFVPDKKIYYMLEGESLSTQAKSTGIGIIELSTTFEELKPDVVITVADRFETMATAIAASYLNIPLAHIQGGEIRLKIINLFIYII